MIVKFVYIDRLWDLIIVDCFIVKKNFYEFYEFDMFVKFKMLFMIYCYYYDR